MKYFTLLLLTNLLPANLLQAQDGWTPEAVIEYKNITQVEVSPEGKYIAYTVREASIEGENSAFVSQIWLAAADASFDVQYSFGNKSSYSPQFSPDGNSLAFLSDRSGEKPQLYMMRVAGGEAKQITDEKTGVSSFKWSPKGDFIAFVRSDADSEEEEKEKREKRKEKCYHRR